MTTLTYDTGALIAAARGDRRMWALHRRALERGGPPIVPAAVLVEAWRGEVDMARALRGCVIEPLDEVNAHASGLLLGQCTVTVEATDAAVCEGALRRHDAVVTGNRSHLEALAAGVARRIDIVDV